MEKTEKKVEKKIIEFELVEYITSDGYKLNVPRMLVDFLDRITDECLILPNSFISVCCDLITVDSFALCIGLIDAEQSILLLSDFTDIADKKDKHRFGGAE